jgi:hypothetical protein
MKINTTRFKLAFKAMTVHFGLSLLVAAIVAFLVFTIWYPYPYRELAGGRELFILVMGVDVVCGPLLTFVLFSPTKPKKELLADVSLIVVIQLLALSYGIWNVWLIRPLFVVQEADRLSIISRTNINRLSLETMSTDLKPRLYSGPTKVSLRQLTSDEVERINADIKAGGNDSAEHPEFYIHFEGHKAFENAHPLKKLLLTNPSKQGDVDLLIASNNIDISQLRYLYIVGRHYWLAVINSEGEIVGYIR